MHHNIVNAEWHMPENFSAAKVPQEALKGALNFGLG